MRCPNCRDRGGPFARSWRQVRDGELVRCDGCGAWVLLQVRDDGWVEVLLQAVSDRGWERDEHR